jgi:hypothetical protein
VSGKSCPCGYKPRSIEDLGKHLRCAHSINRKLALLIARQGCDCYWCRLPLWVFATRYSSHPLRPTIEHLIPKSAGGGGADEGNLRAAHAICNHLRGSMSEAEWREIIAVAMASLPEQGRLTA